MSTAAVVSCPHCSTANRVELARSREQKAKCGKCGAELGVKNGVINTDAKGLQQLIQNADRPVVVDFWAPWCGPCVGFAPTFERVASDSLEKYIFAKVDTQAHPDVAAQFGIRGIPTLVKVFDGREVTRQSGAMPEQMFRQWLSR